MWSEVQSELRLKSFDISNYFKIDFITKFHFVDVVEEKFTINWTSRIKTIVHRTSSFFALYLQNLTHSSLPKKQFDNKFITHCTVTVPAKYIHSVDNVSDK